MMNKIQILDLRVVEVENLTVFSKEDDWKLMKTFKKQLQKDSATGPSDVFWACGCYYG